MRDVLERHVRAEHERVVARREQQVAGHVEPDHVALALRRQQQHPPAQAPALGQPRLALEREHAQRDLRRQMLVGDRDLAGRPLLADDEQRRRDQLDVDLGGGEPAVHRAAHDVLGRLRVAREQRAGEILPKPEQGPDHTTVLLRKPQHGRTSDRGNAPESLRCSAMSHQCVRRHAATLGLCLSFLLTGAAVASASDYDRDGLATPADCDDFDAAILPGAGDRPDLAFEDANCDGIDGDLTKAIFVDKFVGADAQPGTRDAPMYSLAAALPAAKAAGKDIYITGGFFTEPLALEPDMGIYGGYASGFATRQRDRADDPGRGHDRGARGRRHRRRAAAAHALAVRRSRR